MSDSFYKTLCKIGSPFRYQRIGGDYLRTLGAALVVSNHQGAIGPIQCILSLPIRLYPWVIADMVDPKRNSDYLFKDFVNPTLHMDGKIGKRVSNAISLVALPLLRKIDCIPVDRHDARFLGAFRSSLEILKKQKAVLIFPEDPNTPIKDQSGIRSFMNGFLWLCPMYKRVMGKALPVIPVAVCPTKRKMVVDEPIYYEDSGQHKQDMHRLSKILERKINEMYSNTLECDKKV